MSGPGQAERVGARRAVILRGVPGAGKSTAARALALEASLDPGGCVFSTDGLFDEHCDGRFDASLLPRFHQENLARFIRAAGRGCPLVVCDNTNIEPWEFAAYEAAAAALGYQVEVRLVGRPWLAAERRACIARNVRGVPAERIIDMARRLCASVGAAWQEDTA